jgi:hypothetical protein
VTRDGQVWPATPPTSRSGPRSRTTCAAGGSGGSSPRSTPVSPARRTWTICAAPVCTGSPARRMRDGNAHAQAALSRQGRYRAVRDNLRLGKGNPGRPERPAPDRLPQPAQDRTRPARRQEVLERLSAELERSSRPAPVPPSGASRHEGARRPRPRQGRVRATRPARPRALAAAAELGRARAGPQEDRRRGAAGLQVPAVHLRPGPERRGRRAGLQEPARGRARLVGPQSTLDLRPAFNRIEARIWAHAVRAGWRWCSSGSPSGASRSSSPGCTPDPSGTAGTVVQTTLLSEVQAGILQGLPGHPTAPRHHPAPLLTRRFAQPQRSEAEW